MFTWRVREVAERRGITGAAQLAEHAGIAPGTATALWYGRQTRIDLPTLGRVCLALQCAPFEILEYDPEKNGTPEQDELVVAA